MSIEENIQKGLFSQQSEKTYIDKVLARQDVDRIRDLIRKKELTREDLLEMLYLISGTESKLLNYTEWDRYIILKFFVWIREFVKILEILFDYEDQLNKQNNTCRHCGNSIKPKEKEKKCICENKEAVITLSSRSTKLLNNIRLMMEHNAKFLVDLYLNIARSSMSIGGVGFSELIKNKYEVVYGTQNQPEPSKAAGLFRGKSR